MPDPAKSIDYEAHLAELYIRLGKTRKLHAAGEATDAELVRMEYEVKEALRVLGPTIVEKRRAHGK